MYNGLWEPIVIGEVNVMPDIFPTHEYKVSKSEAPFLDEAKRRIVLMPKPKAIEGQVGGDHYKTMPIQPIEYCLKNNIPFAEGNVIKYVSRWRNKGGVADLKKARHMLDVLIESEEARTTAL